MVRIWENSYEGILDSLCGVTQVKLKSTQTITNLERPNHSDPYVSTEGY